MKKELKLILREYGIKQEDLKQRFGWEFNEVTKELLDDLIRQLDIKDWELNRIRERIIRGE